MRLTLSELADAVNELAALNIGSTASSLKSLLNNMRFAFTEALCNLWQSGKCKTAKA